MIYIGADHNGYELKEKVKAFLESAGYEVEDLGAHKLEPADDFCDFAFAVGEAVASNPGSFGILACRNGAGMNFAVNKVRGIRASSPKNPEDAWRARNDDDTNVFVLHQFTFDPAVTLPILEKWLTTPFSGVDRYVRRINKVKEYEEKS